MRLLAFRRNLGGLRQLKKKSWERKLFYLLTPHFGWGQRTMRSYWRNGGATGWCSRPGWGRADS
jgi:hypothetical protein